MENKNFIKENFKSISENFHIIDKEVAILRATVVTKEQFIEARDELKNEIGSIEGQVVKKISMYLGLPLAFFGIASGFLQITNYVKNTSPSSVQQSLPVSSLKLLENTINTNRLQTDMYQALPSQQLNDGHDHDEPLPEKKIIIRGKRPITQQN